MLFILSAGLHLVSAPVWMAAKQMRARDVVYLGQSYVTHLALFFLTPGMARVRESALGVRKDFL